MTLPRCGRLAPDAGGAIEQLEQLVRRQLDLLVTPLGGAELAGDDARPMDPSEVADDERVATLRLVGRAIGQAEEPRAVRVPVVACEVAILVVGARLDLAPVAAQDVLMALDQAFGVLDGGAVQRCTWPSDRVWRSAVSAPGFGGGRGGYRCLADRAGKSRCSRQAPYSAACPSVTPSACSTTSTTRSGRP